MKRSLPIRILRLAALLLLLAGAAELLLVLSVMVNHRRGDEPAPEPLVRAALQAGGMERVEFYSSDGTLLVGDLMGDFVTRPVVVFGHGYRDRRRSGDPLAYALLEAGYAALLFDFRGSGASGGTFTGIGAIEGPDVEAALRFLEGSRGVRPGRTAYVGFSMGAAAGLMAAPALSRLAAVVLIAPYARMEETFEARTLRYAQSRLRPMFAPALWVFRQVLGVDSRNVNPYRHAGDLAPAPLLLIGAGGDWRAPQSDLDLIFKAAREPKKLIVLEPADHRILAGMGPGVQAPILDFLNERLPPRSPDQAGR
ncbi:MAG: alpha/beta fold hydrolase [Planctomycetota bacterium]